MTAATGLGRAFDRGFADDDRFGPGTDFDAVRDRVDFKELLKKPAPK